MRFEINFADTYENPVLFLQVVMGGEPMTAQPVFVESTGALVSLTQPATYDGAHDRDTELNWAVFEAGDYVLPDGRTVNIGAIDSGTSTYDMADGAVIEPNYKPTAETAAFLFPADAAIIAQAQRSHGNTWQTVRIERGTRTETYFDWAAGTVSDIEVIETVTLRHCREEGVEGADDPDITVGPIGYFIIAELPGVQEPLGTGIGEGFAERYEVAEGTTSFNITLPTAVARAFGGDEDSSVSIDVNSTTDGLSIVRVSAVSLLSADNGAYVGEDDTQYHANADFDGASQFIRVSFNDGTSAFISTAQLNSMSANDGALSRSDDDISRSDRFGVKAHDDGTVSMHTYFGHYLSVGADGSLTADATDVSTSEKFYMVDLGDIATSPTPELRIIEQDMDGDNDPEVVLVAEQEDGTGYMLLDPLGIADMMYKAGYAPDDAFISTLSATQQAGLLEELQGINGIDSIDDIDGAMLQSILDAMDGSSIQRDYTSYRLEFLVEGAVYENGATTDDGLFGTTITLGEYTAMVDADLEQGQFELSGSLIAVSGNIGGVLTVTVSAIGANAQMTSTKNGFSIGAGVELIGVTVMVGDEDGSYASISGGIGLGGELSAAWGMNDQYGVTVDVPILPVAVAVYVKGEDVENLALELADLSIAAYDEVAPRAAAAWNACVDKIEQDAGNALANVANDYAEEKAKVSKFGNKAIAYTESNGALIVNEIEDFINDAGSVLNDIGDAFTDGFDSLVDGIADFFSFSWL